MFISHETHYPPEVVTQLRKPNKDFQSAIEFVTLKEKQRRTKLPL
jgi:hypothetical protein